MTRRTTAPVTAAEEQAYADALARALTRPFPDLLDARRRIGRLAECGRMHGDTSGWLDRLTRSIEEELEQSFPLEWEAALSDVAVAEAALVHVPPEQVLPGCPLCRAYQGSNAARRRPPAAPPPRTPDGSRRAPSRRVGAPVGGAR